ncbi:nucleoside deaminase [Clostridium sp. HCP1S3_B4]|uniref:nucleoside deaminase n=1 Tax=unclassified Clostridium TaxID=2614128 RepID=UPI001691D3C5|nr:nucleoside deaminase [Clostridiales bacterium]MDY2729122.1 nucleoside deaminase [Clostridium sp.]NLK22563.1 nucleoside deaminase [Clostridiales bacterium]
MNYMDEAIKEAKKAMNEGEVPIGCVIVKDGIIIGKGHNTKEKEKCSINHAEILAIKEASKKIDNWRLGGTEMYVTMEPCPMCASAIVQSRISKIYIGTFNKDMGACGTVIDIVNNKSLNSSLDVQWVYDKRCSNILSDFFEHRRK